MCNDLCLILYNHLSYRFHILAYIYFFSCKYLFMFAMQFIAGGPLIERGRRLRKLAKKGDLRFLIKMDGSQKGGIQ